MGPLRSFGLALADRKARASARKTASSGVSSKSMVSSDLFGSGRVAQRQFVDQAVLPPARAAQHQVQVLGAAVEQVAVHVPGEADAAVHLDVLLGGEEPSLAGRDARRGGGQRQLRCT